MYFLSDINIKTTKPQIPSNVCPTISLTLPIVFVFKVLSLQYTTDVSSIYGDGMEACVAVDTGNGMGV